MRRGDVGIGESVAPPWKGGRARCASQSTPRMRRITSSDLDDRRRKNRRTDSGRNHKLPSARLSPAPFRPPTGSLSSTDHAVDDLIEALAHAIGEHGGAFLSPKQPDLLSYAVAKRKATLGLPLVEP